MTASQLNELFDSAQKGDPLAQDQLFAHLTERFRYIATQRIWDPTEAEDVVQNAMLIICREYRTLTVTASFAAWAHKVLDNRILTHTRSARGEKRRIEHDPTVLETVSTVAEDLELRRRIIDCLRAIGRINRQYARVLNHQSQGYDSEEICTRMHLKRNSFYSLLRRGRGMLWNCLESGKGR